MKEVLVTMLICAIPISCFIGAAFLAYKKREGWGWLIFAGVLVADSIKIHIS